MRNRDGACAAPNTVNSSVRTREYLTTREIDALMVAAPQSSRYGHRDATMILLGYRHGLRAAELCDLQWSQVELTAGRLHVPGERRVDRRASICSGATKYAPCGGYSAIRRHPGVLVRARRADDSQVLSWLVCPDWRARWPILRSAPSHAPASAAALPWPMQVTTPAPCRLGLGKNLPPAHRTLHGASSGSVQEFLEVTMATNAT